MISPPRTQDESLEAVSHAVAGTAAPAPATSAETVRRVADCARRLAATRLAPESGRLGPRCCSATPSRPDSSGRPTRGRSIRHSRSASWSTGCGRTRCRCSTRTSSRTLITPTVTKPDKDKDPDLQVQFQINNTSHTPVKGGPTKTDPLNAQITLQDVIFRLPTKAGELQIALQSSASFALSKGTGALPRLIESKLTNVQGAAQAAWAVDLFKDLLQVQGFVQFVGGTNFSATTEPVTGILQMNPAPMAQGVVGASITFTVPGTKKRLQIFYQHQESRTYTQGGPTNDRQDTVGVSYAPPIFN